MSSFFESEKKFLVGKRMFRTRKCYFFYFLFTFLVLFKNCNSQSSTSPSGNDDDDGWCYDKYVQPRDKGLEKCLPPRIDMIYSPVDPISVRFLWQQVVAVLQTDIGQHVHMLIYPIANCDLRRVRFHLGDDENEHKPIICTSGPDEATWALEHHCAYKVFTKGHTWGKDWGQREEKRRGMLDGMNYIVCTLNYSHSAQQNIGICRKTLTQEYQKNIEDCLANKKELNFWSIASFELYKTTTYGFYPYIMLDNVHKWEWDRKAVHNFQHLLCTEMTFKPTYCNKFSPTRQ